jgi:lipopolysaccharide transport system ATP-binding protein
LPTTSDMPAIEATDLGKRYRVGAVANYYPTIRETLSNAAHRAAVRAHGLLKGTRHNGPEYAWALDGVSFTIPCGQAVGVIGRNGAGKTTLLKVLTRITRPTRGRARLRGRVGSLLEVGAGFHPELTGRENIFLNGAILGMSRAEIRARFDAIVEFAGVGRYLDTAFKYYSSGMGLRLAFAVAAHLEPEILLVDEILAVGDREFQRKCLSRIDEVAHQGRTVLFVSHDLAAIQSLTARTLLLDGGRCIADGPTSTVVEQYLRNLAPVGQPYQRAARPETPHIGAVRLETSEPKHLQRYGRPFGIEVELHTPAPLEQPTLTVEILSELQQAVLELAFAETGARLRQAGDYCLSCRLPSLRLNAGRYTLRLRLHARGSGGALDQIDGVCPFEVTTHELRTSPLGQSGAVTLEDTEWVVNRRA